MGEDLQKQDDHTMTAALESREPRIPGYIAPAHETAGNWLRQLIIFIGITAILLPISWIAITAFKLPRDVYSLDSAFIFSPTLENLQTVFEHPWNLGSKIFNSLCVAGGTVLLSMTAPDGILFEYFDETMRNSWTLSIAEYVEAWASGVPYGMAPQAA